MKVGVVSPKGGQGVTTVACALAAWHSGYAPTTLVANRDTAACLGIPAGWADYWRDGNLTVTFDNNTDIDGFTVLDGLSGDINILVTRCCYLSLYRAVNDNIADFYKVDGIVVVEEVGRALTAEDVSRTLGRPVFCTIPFAPEISRTIDAGLMLYRMPKTLNRAMTVLHNRLTGKTVPAAV